MRDKLAGLLGEAEGQINNDLPTLEQIADYLIEHGVIVLPCKVGDRIYTIHPLNDFICEATVKAIYYTKDKRYYPKSHIIIQYDLHRGRSRVAFTKIGESVFLTKAEAEKVLAERSNQ